MSASRLPDPHVRVIFGWPASRRWPQRHSTAPLPFRLAFAALKKSCQLLIHRPTSLYAIASPCAVTACSHSSVYIHSILSYSKRTVCVCSTYINEPIQSRILCLCSCECKCSSVRVRHPYTHMLCSPSLIPLDLAPGGRPGTRPLRPDLLQVPRRGLLFAHPYRLLSHLDEKAAL